MRRTEFQDRESFEAWCSERGITLEPHTQDPHKSGDMIGHGGRCVAKYSNNMGQRISIAWLTLHGRA
jgi:hypothetical protein